MIGTKVGVEGWTVVHWARQRHYNDQYYGQFLGARVNTYTGVTEWLVATLYPGSSAKDGMRFGEWMTSQRFAGPRSTDNADDALTRYVEKAHETFVWDRIFEQRAGEAIDRYLAGPETHGAPRMAAGWQRSDPGPSAPFGSATIYLPLHEAKYYLLEFLRSTQLSAMAHLTEGVTLDRHQAVELVRQADKPVRFDYGYNTYWLAAEVPASLV